MNERDYKIKTVNLDDINDMYRQWSLAWVNRQREELGLPTLAEMPQGIPYQPQACPVARGLSGVRMKRRWLIGPKRPQEVKGAVGASHYDIYIDGRVIHYNALLPGMVTAFIQKFDAGRYRRLLEEPYFKVYERLLDD